MDIDVHVDGHDYHVYDEDGDWYDDDATPWWWEARYAAYRPWVGVSQHVIPHVTESYNACRVKPTVFWSHGEEEGDIRAECANVQLEPPCCHGLDEFRVCAKRDADHVIMAESYCKPAEDNIHLCQRGVRDDVVFWGDASCSSNKVGLACCEGTEEVTHCHTPDADGSRGFSVGAVLCLPKSD